MVLAGSRLRLTDTVILLVVAATVGVISPGGNEIGPFLSVEQAALSHVVADERRTDVSPGTTSSARSRPPRGAGAGLIARRPALRTVAARRLSPGCLGYAGIGHRAGRSASGVSARPWRRRGRQSRPPARRAGAARVPAGGLQAVAALRPRRLRRRVRHPEHHRLLVPPPVRPRPGDARHGLPVREPPGRRLGAGRGAARPAHRAGEHDDLHAPAVERAADPGPADARVSWAVGVLLARFSISQMDVPTRQAYTMAVVRPDERSAAAGSRASPVRSGRRSRRCWRRCWSAAPGR